MGESSLIQKIGQILVVLGSTINWVVRIAIKVVKNMVDKSEVQIDDEEAVAFRDVSDTVVHSEDDPDHDDHGHVHYRDVADTVVHPEDDPDHDDHGHVHYRDVADTVVHPEDDPDHDDHGHIHYRDVPDTVDNE